MFKDRLFHNAKIGKQVEKLVDDVNFLKNRIYFFLLQRKNRSEASDLKGKKTKFKP